MRRHGADPVSLVFGLIFLIISGWWLASRFVDINVPHLGWFAAAALIMLGLLGVASSLRGDRTGKEPGKESDREPGKEPVPAPPYHGPIDERSVTSADSAAQSASSDSD